ncbi:MAG: murein biosynthesis integral membrane protein MurJ [Elusimicrobiota bacterium]
MTDHKKITGFISHVTAATSISRILGYFRDMLIAHYFGAGLFADAFYAAYRIPNLFRRLFGEGSVSSAFVPVFSDYIQTKKREETAQLLNVVFTVLVIILFIITVAGIIFSKQISQSIAWGFKSSPEKLLLTTDLTRIMFPFLFFACLAALAMGVLNSLKSFFLPAITPASLSVSEILYVLLFLALCPWATGIPDDFKIRGLAISVVIGGFIQFAIQQAALAKHGFRMKFNFNLSNPGLKKIIVLFLPVSIGFSVEQINSFVDTICASFLVEGSITALYYSNRIMQLPLALFGIAAATVSLPLMSESVAKNDREGMVQTLNFSLRLVLFTLIPASLGLIVIGMPIIEVLFERGSFTGSATAMTYSALALYSTGLLAYAFVKILAGGFYAMKETRIPIRTSAFCMMLNIPLNIILMRRMGIGGLALATAICSWINFILLFYYLRKRTGPLGSRKIIRTFVKVASAAIIMVIVTYLASTFKYPLGILKLVVPVLSGLATYISVSKLLGIEELKPVLGLFMKGAPTGED